MQEHPDFVVFLVDGLRADASGRASAEAAFFEAARLPAGIRFESAYAQAPTPFLSLGSMLTGRYPSSLPLCGPITSAEESGDRPWCMHIPDDTASLPEILGLYGYETLLVTDAIPGAAVLGREFDDWQSFGQPSATSVPFYEEVRTRATEWWEETHGPRLLVVATGAMRLTRKTWARREIGIEANAEHPDSANRDAQQLRALELYEEIGAEVGREAAALFDALDASQRPMVTAVGGLAGTNLVESTPFPGQPVPPLTSGLLLDRTLRVPLRISGPNIEVSQRHEVVELVDLLPTFLARIEARLPARTVGEDLLSIDPDPLAYAQFGDMRTIRMGPYMLTWRAFVHGASTLDPRVTDNIPNALQSPHRLFLHHVDDDPMQEFELKESETDVLRALLVELYRRELLFGTPPEELMSPENIRALQMSSSDGYW